MLSELKEVGKNCWVIEETGVTPLGRRMTVISCKGELFIHSVIQLSDSHLESLSQLGHVSWILVPNMYHTMDISWAAETFPQAEILCTTPLVEKLHKKGLQGLTILPSSLPEELIEHVSFKIMESVKHTEVECYHAESKSLILTDILFNLSMKDRGVLERVFHKLNQSDRFGPSRIFKSFFMLNRDVLLEEIDELLSLDFETIIVSHGDIITEHAKEKLESYKRLL